LVIIGFEPAERACRVRCRLAQPRDWNPRTPTSRDVFTPSKVL